VFVLDGVLIGAGDGRYLALAGVVNLVVFAPLALTVSRLGGSVTTLWWAFGGFMVMRMVTLVWRERGDGWLVLGSAQPERLGRNPGRSPTARRGRPRR
jgi:MATE family, multidrug efflux pump